jgi:hypothetical protein
MRGCGPPAWTGQRPLSGSERAQQQESPFDRPSSLPAVRHPPPFDQATTTTADASLGQELFPPMVGVIGVRWSW